MPTSSERMSYGPRGRLLGVLALQCAGKTLKNKIEFYNIIKLDLKLDFSEDLMVLCLDSH